MGLSGWTKVGDRVDPTGSWTVYRHKGRDFDDVEVVDSVPDQSLAVKRYSSAADGARRGGVWLVSPDGLVVDVKFVR